VAVAVALLTPVAVLFAQIWSSTGDRLAFAADERRGAAYLGPLIRLLSVTTDAQSRAVSGKPVDPAPVRAAIAEIDQVDARLGDRLRTTERWTTIRTIVQDRTGHAWPRPTEAYTQYSDLVTQLMELNRKVGDASRLILDPELDSYYVMSAALLRIPDILVDSGRYTDLSVLAEASGLPDRDSAAQLTAARNRVATNAIDLSDGLVKAFGSTASSTLGPGLTRPLDNFRTAVDAVAPSNSLLAPAPERSPTDLESDQDELQRRSLELQEAALGELDRLLVARQDGAERVRLVAVGALLLGLVVAGIAAVALRPGWVVGGEPGPEPVDRDEDLADPNAAARPRRRYRGPGGPQPAPGRPAAGQPVTGRGGPGTPAPGLVGALGPEPGGGARAAR
jgi:hypothetical protein